jgi:uncharacterized membrane protein (DUF485 family)
MLLHDYHALSELPEYKLLLERRYKLVWPLVGIITFAYFSFILLIAFSPASLGVTVGSGVVSIGIIGGVGAHRSHLCHHGYLCPSRE